MAATLALSLTLSSDQLQPHQRRPFISLSINRKHSSLYFVTKPHSCISFSSSPHSSSTKPTELTTSGAATYSSLEESFRTGRFLSNEELEKLKDLQDFSFCKELPSGSLCIRVMRPDDMDVIVRLLAESFSESMLYPVGYERFMRFKVKNYLIERKAVLPHAVTLIGFYRGKEQEEEENELAGTVEVSFDKRGANASSTTPTPPKDSPYIGNMTVKKSLRRKGIGWNLLKASEELISQMNCKKEVYLHCRMIDSVPFNMYIKAGYSVVRTDGPWVVYLLRKRKHLMYKKLSDEKQIPLTLDALASDSEHSSEMNMQT